MKKILVISGLIMLTSMTLTAQESDAATEAGEDFDLSAVMSVMEDAEDLADLEKKINDSETQINNLDLNKDDEIDIIKIVEYDENQTRLLVLRAVLGDNDYQDVATIEIEKHSEEEISLQIIGDADLYGEDYILEPASDDSDKGGQGEGDDFYEFMKYSETTSVAVFVSVHRWRPIRPLFVVGRVAFVSAVVWRPAPVWFVVRRPIARSTWRKRSRRYSKNRYRSSKNRHSRNGRNMYSNKRKKSPTAKKNVGKKPSATPSSNQVKKTGSTSNSKAKTSNASTKPTSTNTQKSKTTTSTSKPKTSPNKSVPSKKAVSPKKR